MRLDSSVIKKLIILEEYPPYLEYLRVSQLFVVRCATSQFPAASGKNRPQGQCCAEVRFRLGYLSISRRKWIPGRSRDRPMGRRRYVHIPHSTEAKPHLYSPFQCTHNFISSVIFHTRSKESSLSLSYSATYQHGHGFSSMVACL